MVNIEQLAAFKPTSLGRLLGFAALNARVEMEDQKSGPGNDGCIFVRNLTLSHPAMGFAVVGWVVTAERIKSRSARRHYLVAAETKDAAILATHNELGICFRVEVIGPAAGVHFKRRSMKNGDVFRL